MRDRMSHRKFQNGCKHFRVFRKRPKVSYELLQSCALMRTTFWKHHHHRVRPRRFVKFWVFFCFVLRARSILIRAHHYEPSSLTLVKMSTTRSLSSSKGSKKSLPFYEAPKKQTSAQIIAEARKSVRSLPTDRPYTPATSGRILFGNQDGLSRPPSVFR